MATPTFLMIGASGRMGVQLIRAASSHPSHPPIHAFCRTPSKLSSDDTALCASVQQGDATKASDIERALSATNAGTILISVGVPNSTAPSDIREKSAAATLSVVSSSKFAHIRVVVVSAVGAGGSKIDYGWGIGTVVAWVLRHGMKDHDRQEEILGKIGNRLMIVRPMGLGDGEGGGVRVFEGRAPKLTVERQDLAQWIVREVLEGNRFGTAVNVTGGVS